jgi:hypothetical protein
MKNLTMERGIGFHKRPHKPQEKREREKMHLFVFVECGKVGYIGPISIEIPYLFLFTAVELGTVSHSHAHS